MLYCPKCKKDIKESDAKVNNVFLYVCPLCKELLLVDNNSDKKEDDKDAMPKM